MAQAVSQNLENWQARIDKVLHEKNAFTDVLEKIETKTNVRRLYIVLGLGAFLALYLMIGYGADFLCNFIGFLYPAYASVKAIESKGKDDDTKWLTYWVVYSAFALCEFFTDIFLFWIPLYWFFKCLFLIYCMLPIQANGSIKIYTTIIRPFVLKHQTKVDKALDEAGSLATDMINEARQASDTAIEKTLNEAQDAASDAAADAVRRQMDSAKTD